MLPKRILLWANQQQVDELRSALRADFPEAECIDVDGAWLSAHALSDTDLVIVSDGVDLSINPAPPATWAAVVSDPANAQSLPVDVWVRRAPGWPSELRARLAGLTRPPRPPTYTRHSVGRFLIDHRGNILKADASAQRLLAQITGAGEVASVWDVLPADAHPRVRALLSRIFASAEVFRDRIFFIPNRSGGTTAVLVTARPIRRHGQVVSALCTYRPAPCLRAIADTVDDQNAWLEQVSSAFALLPELPTAEAAAEACRQVCALFSADAAAVIVSTEETNGQLAGFCGAPRAKTVIDDILTTWPRLAELSSRRLLTGSTEDEDGHTWNWLASILPIRTSLHLLLLSTAQSPVCWSDEEIAVFSAWASRALQSLYLAWLRDELHSRSRVVRAIRLLHTSSSSLEATQIIAATAQALARLPDAVATWAVAQSTDEIVGHSHAGAEPTSIGAQHVALSIGRQAIKSDRESHATWAPPASSPPGHAATLYLCAVPVRTDSQTHGAIVVAFPTKAHALLASETLSFAAQAAAGAIASSLSTAAVRVSEAHYRAIFECSAAAAMVVDKNGWIRLVNRRFEELTGYSREEVIGRMKAITLAAPHEWPRLHMMRQRRLQGEQSVPSTYEVDYVTKEGQQRRGLLSVGMVDGGDQVVTFIDLTRERELRRQLMQTEKSAALGQLVAGVAHEINNPLGAILGSAELALAATTNPTIERNLRRIIDETERCRRIVANLLSFARSHYQELQPVDVNLIIQQVVEIEAYQMTVDNVKVRLLLDPDLPRVQADPAALQQVLLNLVVNAHQAMKQTGGGQLTIETSLRRGKVLVSVADTGPGIPRENMSRIFDPFFTTKPPGEGTGLGLSVSLGIIQELGGRIWAESTPGQGATFFIELPVAKKQQLPPPEPTFEGEGPIAPSCTRVLIVDDEPAVRDVLESALEAAGYFVQSARDGDEALLMLRTGDFHVVVCDLRLPGLDGTRLHELMADERPKLARRFVFITGDTVSPETRKFLQASGCRSLPKPFRLSQLRQVVAEVASRAHKSEKASRRRKKK